MKALHGQLAALEGAQAESQVGPGRAALLGSRGRPGTTPRCADARGLGCFSRVHTRGCLYSCRAASSSGVNKPPPHTHTHTLVFLPGRAPRPGRGGASVDLRIWCLCLVRAGCWANAPSGGAEALTRGPPGTRLMETCPFEAALPLCSQLTSSLWFL